MFYWLSLRSGSTIANEVLPTSLITPGRKSAARDSLSRFYGSVSVSLSFPVVPVQRHLAYEV